MTMEKEKLHSLRIRTEKAWGIELNLKEAMVYKDPVPVAFATHGLVYGIAYAGGVMLLTMAVFSRRDLQ